MSKFEIQDLYYCKKKRLKKNGLQTQEEREDEKIFSIGII